MTAGIVFGLMLPLAPKFVHGVEQMNLKLIPGLHYYLKASGSSFPAFFIKFMKCSHSLKSGCGPLQQDVRGERDAMR
jgi:hypothetical protein